MIKCNGNHKTNRWMRILCVFGIHWHGRTDGGGMGDATQCHVCGLDTYGGGFIVHKEENETTWLDLYYEEHSDKDKLELGQRSFLLMYFDSVDEINNYVIENHGNFVINSPKLTIKDVAIYLMVEGVQHEQ